MSDGQGGTWLGLAEAGRRLGLSADALRKQIRRGRCRYQVRRDNTGQWSILVPDADETVRADSSPGVPDPSALLAERDVQLARLEERLAAAAVMEAELREQVAALRVELHREATQGLVERDRLLALLESALAERRAPARRPWPGLKAWWRRVWEGEGSG